MSQNLNGSALAFHGADKLPTNYTKQFANFPGVVYPGEENAKGLAVAFRHTEGSNLVLVNSDGTAVLDFSELGQFLYGLACVCCSSTTNAVAAAEGQTCFINQDIVRALDALAA